MESRSDMTGHCATAAEEKARREARRSKWTLPLPIAGDNLDCGGKRSATPLSVGGLRSQGNSGVGERFDSYHIRHNRRTSALNCDSAENATSLWAGPVG